MEIPNNSSIKIFCHNGLSEAGKLIEYTDDQLVLELVDKSLVIINKPKYNILAIKIFLPEQKEKSIPVEEHVYVDVEEKPTEYFKDENLRVKNLAELHLLKANEERKRAQELLKSNRLKPLSEVQFGLPDFTKPIPKHPKKKAR